MNNLVIIGCGGVGKYVKHTIYEINAISETWNVLGFLDDDVNKYSNANISGIPVLGSSSWLKKNTGVSVVIALSDPHVKYRMVKQLKFYGCKNFPKIIHPNTWIANSVTIGEGSIIYPGTTINVDSIIGEFSMINMNCAIGHDVRIKDYSFLAPNVGIGGNTVISEGCAVGMGASVVQHIVIGERVIVGAGAVVVDNVKPDQTVVGVPAKPVKNF